MRAVQALPDPPLRGADLRLRERIVSLTARLQPPPVTPEEAERLTVRGQVLFKDAKDETEFEEAAAELRKAVRAAPWVPAFAFNLALVQEKLQYYKTASANLKVYLSSNPPDATDVRAKMYELEIRLEKSPKMITWKDDCASRVAGACVQLGQAYFRGDGIPKDLDRALEFFSRACDGEDTKGCGLLIGYGWRADGKVSARAVALLSAACNGGKAEDCHSLGRAHAWGLGAPKDEMRGAELYKQACDSGFGSGCVSLAYAYKRGEGVTKDLSHAAQLFEQSCTRRVADAVTHWPPPSRMVKASRRTRLERRRCTVRAHVDPRSP